MGIFNTLEHSGTDKTGQSHLFVSGKGSDLSKIKALKGRAKCKTITQSMMFKFIDVVKENEDNERVRAYWNTYHCQQKVTTVNGRLYGNYCRNRFCTLCARIRKADIINRYYPILKNWEDPHFVTITVKSCKAHQLDAYFRNLKKTFKRIIEKHKKQDQRGTGNKLIGIKSLESNYNPIKRTYNPHFHVLVANEEMANRIVSEWVERSKKGYVNIDAQDIQRVWDLEKKLIETIKYSSKVFTEPKEEEVESNVSPQIYIKALDTIYKAMKGRRIFDRFGFNLPKGEAKKAIINRISGNAKHWEFDLKYCDWLKDEGDEVLTKYKIPSNMLAILENNLNTDLA